MTLRTRCLVGLLLFLSVSPGVTRADDFSDLPVEGESATIDDPVGLRKPRAQAPNYLGLAVGNPSPSWIGFVYGRNLGSLFEVRAAGGFFALHDISVSSLAAQARFYMLWTKLAPFFSAGTSLYFITGKGKFQGLKTTTSLLPFLNLGLDFIADGTFRVAAGVNFHFPVKLTFPFVELGVSF